MPWSPAAYRDLLSGRRRGLAASVLRGTLRVAEWPYGLAIRTRNRAYDRGWLTSHGVGIPVISVGNLTVGGTGKTPLIEWLARWFRARDMPVGVVSRGYKARAGRPNDEACELAEKLPGLPHVQQPDRVAGVRELVARYGCRVVLLDDAFQHRRIRRDLELVLLDAFEPFGWEHLLPRGTLREPVSGLARADLIGLSRSDALSHSQRAAICARVRRLAPAAAWLELEHQPQGLRTAEGAEQPLERLTGRRVAAFCGIGNPAGFRHTLDRLACEVTGFRCFPDHYAYTAEQVGKLEAWLAGQPDLDAVVCTRKDLVKLNRVSLAGYDLLAVTIGLSIRQGQAHLESRLEALFASQRSGTALACPPRATEPGRFLGKDGCGVR